MGSIHLYASTGDVVICSESAPADSTLNLQHEEEEEREEKETRGNPLNKAQQFIVNIYNKQTSFAFLFFVIGTHIGLIIHRIVELQDQNAAVIIAKLADYKTVFSNGIWDITGQSLHFDVILVLMLVLRRFITWMHTVGVDCILPLDRNIHIHKMVGWTIVAFSSIHTVAHLANYGVISFEGNMTYSEALIETHWDVGLISGTVMPTGFALLGILMIMATFAHQKVRRSGWFELFYWTHFLYVPFLVLLLIHGRNAWKWLVAPLVLYGLEVLNRKICIYSGHGQTEITLMNALPNDVIHLRIRRPDFFEYECGDWLFINIPQVAKYEWHAFTISSEPEAFEYITLHIRVVGEWTRRLQTLCCSKSRFWTVEDSMALQRESKLVVIDTKMQQIFDLSSVKIPVRLDGPYAGSTTHAWSYPQSIFVAGGIGVTPFASLLQSIMRRFKDSMVKCSNCSHLNCERLPSSFGKLKHVDFLWVNRDLNNFKWFLELLVELEEEKEVAGKIMADFLNIQLYQTGKNKIQHPGRCSSIECSHPSSLNTTCDYKLQRIEHLLNYGRPNWDQVFSDVKARRNGRVCVFFCGPTSMGLALKKKCKKFGFRFVKELS